MKIKTGITEIDGKYSPYLKIDGYKFNLYPQSEKENAEWIKDQLKFALKELKREGE